jgi:hypothetical protein
MRSKAAKSPAISVIGQADDQVFERKGRVDDTTTAIKAK